MNVTAFHYGAASRAIPAPAQALRATDKPAELPQVQPTHRAFEDPRGKIREQVLAERGLDIAVMMKMAPEARIQAEIAIAGEVAQRLGGQRMVDVRV